jgi:hypothetical protein
MKSSAKPRGNPTIASRQILPGEAILVNLDTSASLVLKNLTAILLWQLVDGQRTVQEIIAAVRHECPDAPPAADDDIIEMLDLLEARGFILVE